MKKATIYLATCILLLCLSVNGYSQNEVQRVRINFETPEGFVRHLLLGFTPDDAATDGFDYGYDAPNIEDHPDDMNWMIEDDRYVIQGVGAFDHSKAYPLGIFMTNSGTVNISLMSLENFPGPINVFIYDVNNASFHQINDADFSFNLPAGDYHENYFITFSTNAAISGTLNISEETIDSFSIKFLKNSKELVFQSETNNRIDKIEIYNLLGQIIAKQINPNQNRVLIPIHNYATQPLLARIQSGQKSYVKRIIPY